jgi:hypothetical protein
VIEIRKGEDRGHFDHGWLDTYHTFSFADYHDPEQMGWSRLRVLNDDTVAPGEGFPPHSHRDMEIVTLVLEGALEHRDSMGNGSIIRPGDVQRMSAGTGVTHSEYNPSDTEPVHLLQIWILPAERHLQPSYEQMTFPESERLGRLRLVASPDGRDGSVRIHQDATLHAAMLRRGEKARHRLAPGRKAYVHVARGEATVQGMPLRGGDGARIAEENEVRLEGLRDADVLLFDLPS